MPSILVTGGAGYIGSHVCLELLEAGYEVISADNYSNSSPESLKRVERIAGKPIQQYEADLLNPPEISKMFENHAIEAVIHLAGFKAVNESVQKPLKYYKNNIIGTINLLEIMQHYNVKKMVFSSSASVYGNPESVPVTESAPVRPMHPYGRTKAILEAILQDLTMSDPSWSIVALRYFNPVGAHSSGLIGEDPKGSPENLLPYITQVAAGKLKELKIFGNDYDTPDGTGVRDYIHVCDLANAHVKALQKACSSSGMHYYNLGTGKGFSVLEMLRMFEAVSEKQIPYVITDRRPGDIAVCYADPSLAQRELGWSAKKNLRDMCEDAWRWQSNNPRGYDS